MEYANSGAFDSTKYLKAQMQRSQDAEFPRSTAESLVRARLHNSRVLLLQLSQASRHATVQQVLTLLQRLIDDLSEASSVIALKSHESTGSAFYRAALRKLLPAEFQYDN